jgi:hypothetical protein
LGNTEHRRVGKRAVTTVRRGVVKKIADEVLQRFSFNGAIFKGDMSEVRFGEDNGEGWKLDTQTRMTDGSSCLKGIAE